MDEWMHVCAKLSSVGFLSLALSTVQGYIVKGNKIGGIKDKGHRLKRSSVISHQVQCTVYYITYYILHITGTSTSNC